MIIKIFNSDGVLATEFQCSVGDLPRVIIEDIEKISLVLINEGSEYAEVRYEDSLAYPVGFIERRLPATLIDGKAVRTVAEAVIQMRNNP